MIELTRLNGSPLVVNSDLIKYAEASPDTMLTLVSGEKLVVLESCAEVITRVSAYRASLFAEAAPAVSGGQLCGAGLFLGIARAYRRTGRA